MQPSFEQFFLAFIPIFIAIDPLGLIPLFTAITQGIKASTMKRIAIQAIFTAGIVAIGFVFLGKLIFKFLGITVYDFQIAGGLILFVLAARDLVSAAEMSRLIPREDIGVVPLGMPIIAGPALITTLLILVDTVGLSYTLAALGINFLLVALAFRFQRMVTQIVSVTGLKAISKIISLLLAAIAINMIRRGWQGMI